jgi:putative nucleotidyltransferase with HDIG domain
MGPGAAVIDRAIRAIDRLPPPAPVMSSLLAELSTDETSFARLERLIEKDSILTAAFLQRANSAIFQRGSSVRSVLQALTLLGIEDLRHFVLSLSSNWTSPRIQLPPTFSRTRYSRHASATALMTGLIERQAGYIHGADAHLAALLHDVSRLLVATGLPEEFGRIAERGRWDEDREMECLGMNHGELSAIVLRAWKMPPEVSEAVERHHGEPPADSRPNLAVILNAADRYTAVLANTAEPEAGDFDERLLFGLGMDAAVPALVADFQTQAHLVRS